MGVCRISWAGSFYDAQPVTRAEAFHSGHHLAPVQQLMVVSGFRREVGSICSPKIRWASSMASRIQVAGGYFVPGGLLRQISRRVQKGNLPRSRPLSRRGTTRKAVDKVGNSAAAVRKELGR
jgi:hypothetical protein